jgi:hypothetical protein
MTAGTTPTRNNTRRTPKRRSGRTPPGGQADGGADLAGHRPAPVEFAWLLKGQGHTLGEIAAKTGIPKTSLHRYLTAVADRVLVSEMSPGPQS